jgi:hypothetical protein
MAVPLHSSVARPALVGYAGARIGVEWSAWFCIAVLCGPGARLSADVSPLDSYWASSGTNWWPATGHFARLTGAPGPRRGYAAGMSYCRRRATAIC